MATNIAYGLSSTKQHKPSNPVHVDWLDPDDSQTKKDVSSPNYEAVNPIHSTQLIEKTDDSEWYRVSIPIKDKTEEEESTVYLAHAVYSADGFTRMTVRNVGYYPSETSVSFGVENGAGETSQNGTISVKADGKDVTLQDGVPGKGQIELGARLTLTANTNPSSFFYGWQEVIDGKKRIFSYDKTASYSVMAAEVKIVALVAPQGTYAVRYNGELYNPENLQQALNAAGSGTDKDVVVIDNVEIKGDITIPTGVKLIIPYNAKGSYYEEGTAKNAGSAVSWRENGTYATPVYKFTFAEGAKVTVNGELYVGGIIHYPSQAAQAHTSGAYSELVLDGNITVANGGLMDVYGRVTGKGGITVESGGKLIQPFMILDYNGGENTQDTFNKYLTPFKMYSMVNIQCTGGFTINYGGLLYGHASLYFWSSITTIDQPFVTYQGASGNDKTALIILDKEESSAKFVYNDEHKRPEMGSSNNAQDTGKTTITLTKDATAGYMSFPLGINTSKVYFSIPYNFELILQDGEFTLAYPYKLMPGAILNVKQGATLTIKKGAGLDVYDSFADPEVAKRTYPTSKQLTDAGYNSFASLIVGGTLKVETGAELLGIVQSGGTSGRLEIATGVTLSRTFYDGVSTIYTCNYTGYTLVAHVWDAAHGVMAPLQAGHNYDAVQCEQWTLPGLKFDIETQTAKASHGNNHTPKPVTTPEAIVSTTDGLGTVIAGSWKVEHGQHVIDWKSASGDTAPTHGHNETVTHRCSEIGCSEEVTRTILFAEESLGELTFTGENFGDADLLKLFKVLFGEIEGVSFEYTPFKDASVQPYEIKITLPEGYLWREGSAYKSVRTLTVKVVSVGNLSAENVQGLEGGKLAAKQYTGSQIAVEDITIEYEGKTLQKGTDYSLSFGTNKDVATGGTVNVTGEGNFKGSSFTLSFDITAVDISSGNLTVSGSYTYNGENQTPDRSNLNIANVAGFSNGDITVTISATDNKNAGTAHVTVNGSDNFTGELTADFNIEKKHITVKADAIAVTYGESNENLTWTVDPGELVGGDERGVLDVKLSRAPGDTVNDEGYQITGTGTADNYEITVTPATYTVKAKDVTVTVTKQTWATYNGEAQNAKSSVEDWTIAPESLVRGDDKAKLGVSLIASYTDAGTYDIVASASNKNYNVTFEGESEAFVIAQASIEIQADDLSSALGDDIIQKYTYHFLNNTRFFSDADKNEFDQKLTYKCEANNQVTNDYDIVLTVQDGFTMKNYDIKQPKNGKYHVTDSLFAGVTFEGEEHDYDGNTYTLTAKGSIPEHAVTTYKVKGADGQFTETFEGARNAGTYEIQVEITIDGHASKYTKTATLTIRKKHITVKADAVTVTYGETKDLTWTIEDGELVSGDDKSMLTVNLVREQGNDVKQGGYQITGTGSATNYEIAVTPATYTINAKDIREAKVTVKGSYTYTSEAIVPEKGSVEVTLSGFDSVTFDFQVTNNVNVADEPVVTVTGKGNFTGTATGTFTITPARIDSVKVEGTYTYNSQPVAPQLVVKSGALSLTANDFDVTYPSGNVNAGTVSFNVAGKGNFDGTLTSNFEIAKAKVGVKILKQTFTYNGEVPMISQAENTAWTITSGEVFGEDSLGISLSASLTSAADEYEITRNYSNNNYEVTFDSIEAKVVIERAIITVTVEGKSSLYGAQPEALTVDVAGIIAKDEHEINIANYITLGCEVTNATGAGNYDITCVKSGDPKNYTINIVLGAKYEVQKRPVTVTISDQNDVYGFNKQQQYAFDGAAWSVDENTLANDEKKDVLHVTLEKPSFEGAGTYAIKASYSSANYAVTFKGNWREEDENKNVAGVYTISKLTLVDGENDTHFVLKVNGEAFNEQNPELYKYLGVDIELEAEVWVLEGISIEHDATVSPAKLGSVGVFDVTVTVVDDNYAGSKTYRVEVVGGDGYSKNLHDVLEALEALVGDLTVDTLTSTAENFAIVKGIESEIAKLSESEKELAGEELDKYQAIVDAWNEAADIDEDVIDTAKAIADSPIKWLFAIVAAQAMIAAMFVVGKGGLL